jgi:hypothetical protein
LILYLSTSPVTALSGLTEATLVSIFPDRDGKFLDYPVPGVDYYYVLIDEMNLQTGTIPIVLDVNSTSRPVRIPSGLFRVGLPEISSVSRDIPLPYLVISTTVSQGSSLSRELIDLPNSVRLSAEAAKAADRIAILAGWREAPVPSVYIFPEDLVLAGSIGEEYTLRSIIADQFSKGKWAEAVDRFSKYLSIHRTPQSTARAQFYLGEALAKANRYKDAFFTFLLSQEYYAPNTTSWIDFLLRKLR